MQDVELTNGERALIGFSAILFLLGTYLYITDFPLRKYLFGIQDGTGQKEIGYVENKKGSMLREIRGDADFRPIETKGHVYEDDTVVTAPGGSATVSLSDGGKIDLGPSTMIRLTFENQLSLGGISRVANVQVLTGDVKAKAGDTKVILHDGKNVITVTGEEKSLKSAKKPQFIAKVDPLAIPKPIPTRTPPPTASPIPPPPKVDLVDLQYPQPRARITVDKGSSVAEKIIEFRWQVQPANTKMVLSLKKLDGAGKGEILSKPVASASGAGRYAWLARRPGLYEWELQPEDPKTQLGKSVTTKARFTVEPGYEAIQPLEPLVAGESITSNVFTGRSIKKFGITLRWKPYGDVKDYRLQFLSAPQNGKLLMEKMVDQPQYDLNRGKVYNGRIFYRVSATMPNGFVASSEVQPFVFNFLPPILAIPPDQVSLSRKDIATSNDNAVLFTWQKTNFTDHYIFEVARDAAFSQLYFQETLTDNFYVFKHPGPGEYWWRVRSLSKALSSPYSKTNHFSITN